MLYHDIKSELKEYLDPNEVLIWIGEPKTGIIFRPYDIFIIPFSLLWCGFAIFWMIMAAQGSIFFALFGVPFVIVGLMFVFGRFILDARMRANTIYGLTEDRIIIKSGISSKKINSINIKALPEIEYTEKADGSGTIMIGPKNPMMMMANGMNWMPGNKFNPSLDMIPEVRKVYTMIIEQQRKK